MQKGGHCHLFWGHSGSHGGVGRHVLVVAQFRCLFGLAQQEFMEHLLWADWQEGGGSITTLELQKGTAAHPSVPSEADRRAGETALSVKGLPCTQRT